MSNKTEKRQLLTARHVSEITALSERTVWQLSKENQLPPAITVGKKNIRWRRLDIMQWIELGCPDKGELKQSNELSKTS